MKSKYCYTMITKEKFCEIIEMFKKQNGNDNNFYEGMKKAFPDSYAPILPTGEIWSAAIKALEAAVGDEYGTIEWWVNEDNMEGRLSITENDGTEYTFKDGGELYDYLVSSQS